MLRQIIGDTYRTFVIAGFCRYYNDKIYNDIEKKNINYKLPKNLEKDYVEYYRSFGFKYVSLNQIRLIYGLTGQYDKKILSDEIFSTYIDSPYMANRDFWQNKAYQEKIVPLGIYPNTIIKNVNGYYLDSNDDIISEEKAIRVLSEYDRVVVKPAVFSGGGLNVNFYQGNEINHSILSGYNKNFVIQEKLKQSSLMASFNEGAVNTEKIISFLYRGEVYILSSFLRVAPIGKENDNVTNGYGGYKVQIREDGSLGDYGIDNGYNKIFKTLSGKDLSSIVLPQHKKCMEIIKKAHKKLLYFPIVSWDFAQGEDGEPVLIEYNLKWHILYHYQILTGPFFGELTDDVLTEAGQAAKHSKSLIYR